MHVERSEQPRGSTACRLKKLTSCARRSSALPCARRTSVTLLQHGESARRITSRSAEKSMRVLVVLSGVQKFGSGISSCRCTTATRQVQPQDFHLAPMMDMRGRTRASRTRIDSSANDWSTATAKRAHSGDLCVTATSPHRCVQGIAVGVPDGPGRAQVRQPWTPTDLHQPLFINLGHPPIRDPQCVCAGLGLFHNSDAGYG